jgi:multicomponent Na+:H+ antiporter subunit D
MYSLHPGLILILAGILILILPKKAEKWIALFGSIAAMGAWFTLSVDSKMEMNLFGLANCSLMKVDQISKIFSLIFVIIALISAVYSFRTIGKGQKTALLIYAGGSICTVLSADLISFLCFWELMAIASAYAVYAGSGPDAKRSSYRYLIMHLFGGNMVLAGVIVLQTQGITQVTNISDVSGAAFWLMLIGIGINAAMPPFHTWLPDSYPEATPEGMVYLGSFTTKVAIYALIRFFAGTEWLALYGVLMSIFAACMAMIANDLRKILSYHIISQLGMMIAGLATGSAAGIAGATLHAAFHIMYKGTLIMGIGNIFYATGGLRKVSDLAGMWKKMPFTAICFLIASLSIAGFPFLNGFAGKTLTMHALSDAGMGATHILMAVAGVGTWLSVTLKINWFVFFRKPETKEQEAVKCEKVPLYRNLAIGAGAALCVLNGVWPNLAFGMIGQETGHYHLFSAVHILQYIVLFAAATVPFIVLYRRMKPHEGFNLDLDYFYRKAIPVVVYALAKAFHAAFGFCMGIYDKVAAWLSNVVNMPYALRRRYGDQEILEDEERLPIGVTINLIGFFLIMALIIVILIQAFG